VHRSARRVIAEETAEARLRGVLIHALLQRLPTLSVERREAAARAYVRVRAPRLEAAKGEAVVTDALAVLRHEALVELFGPTSRAEVAITGRVAHAGEERPVSGRIDRLAVLADEVLVADFKSNASVRRPEEAPSATHAAQLALYRELLREIYPGRRVRAFLIWTAGPWIQELPEGELKRALDLVTAA
jgi:ATP-dependent helicase/nuclease subunit A